MDADDLFRFRYARAMIVADTDVIRQTDDSRQWNYS